MKHGWKIGLGVVLCLTFMALPRVVAAQGTSTASIAGVVRDASGGVMPGVVVEATSPALIEKVRSTVTESDGQYRITELRPGTYSVRFTLPGFRVFVREGVQLPVNFTATINAVLEVGALEETVTVTGESPLVDIQNVRDQSRVSRDQIDTLPSNRSLYAYAAFTPAVIIAPRTQDVGGGMGESKIAISVHGSREDDYKTMQDGMPVTNMQQSGSARGYVINPLTASEMVIDMGGGGSAEASTGGAKVNVIPKDGGNTFAGTFFTSGTGDALQTSNLTPELREQGLTRVNGVATMHDFNGVVSGPIKRDRLWFLTSHRVWGRKASIADLYEDAGRSDFVYTPDLNKPVRAPERNRAHNGRFTLQASPRDKITASYDWQYYHGPNNQGALSPTDRAWEVRGNSYCPETRLYQFTWTRPQSNRILFEGGFSRLQFHMFGTGKWRAPLPDGRIPTGQMDPVCDDSPDHVQMTEQNLAASPRLWNGVGNRQRRRQIHENVRFTMSYVTGAHNFKVGMYTQTGGSQFYTVRDPLDVGGLPVAYRLNTGVPNQLTQYVTPLRDDTEMGPEVALFAQDQWTVKRLTLTYGLRFEYLREWVPAFDRAAGPLSDAASFPKVDCVPCWKDINPRAAVSYDLFGDGKTAVKASVGRYVAAGTIEWATIFSPAAATVSSTTRSWRDTNGNWLPDCDLRSPDANGECGPMANRSFGGTRLRARPDPDWITGWGKRGYNWHTSVSVERELFLGLAMNAGYYRRWFGNQTITDNTLVTPDDYDPYCVTAPVDPRLGSVSGSQICGLYDIKPAKFGQVDEVISLASKFGEYTEAFSGFDVGLQARLPGGANVSGGVAVGNSVGDNAGTGSTAMKFKRCFAVDSPQELYNCESGNPQRVQLKVNGAAPLPWGFQAAAVFQSIPGPNYQAQATFSSAQIAPTLGRPLSGGTSNVTIDLLQPWSAFIKDRVTQLDLRLSKKFTVGRWRAQVNADAFNVLNASAVLNPTGTYGTVGAGWLRPIHTLEARIFKFGVQVDF